MTLEVAKKFVAGIEKAGITKYQFTTDVGTHYYNDENSFNIIDMVSESVVNVRSREKIATPAYSQGVAVYVSDFGDIHEARFGGTAEQVKKFIESYGHELTNDQLKILLKLDNDNYTINPATGNYNFIPLTDKEIEKLSDEEKEKYNENYKKHCVELRKGVAARIDTY